MLSLSSFYVIDNPVLPGFVSRHPVLAIYGDQYFGFRSGSDGREDLGSAITSKLDASFQSVEIASVTARVNRWLAKTDTRVSVGSSLSLLAGSQENCTHPTSFPNTIGADSAG